MVPGFAGLISVMMIRVIFLQGFFHGFLNSRHGPCEDFLVNLHGFILYERHFLYHRLPGGRLVEINQAVDFFLREKLAVNAGQLGLHFFQIGRAHV